MTYYKNLFSTFQSDTKKATWIEKRVDNDPSSFFIHVQLFLSDRPVIGIWIKQVNDWTQKLEKKVCYLQEITVVEDAEEAKEREIGLHYLESNVYGVFQPQSLQDEAAQDLIQTNAQASSKFQAMIPDMNNGGIRTLGLTLDLKFDYPGWRRTEWGTVGVKPGASSDW